MSSRYITTLSALILTLMLFIPAKSFSQIIKATGNNNEASSQLVYWYAEDDGTDEDTRIQVTNTNDTEGVWIHVQIFRTFDVSDTVVARCDERNFIDFLTPNDTHIYDLFDPQLNSTDITKNMGEDEVTLGEAVTIDPTDTEGFVLITPVVSEADLTAISFQHLVGMFYIDDRYYNSNAMGRDAVDFATGEVLPQGTPLDGVTGGFVVLQPSELVFNFSDDEGSTNSVNLVGITFKDIYGDPGLLGYTVEPANATWTSFIFDYKEDPTSCGNRVIECFDDIGLDDTDFDRDNDIFGNSEDVLCAGFDPPANDNDSGDTYGWTRIFVSGLGDFVNHLGVWGEQNTEGSAWVYTK